jgi:hypothetical protein
MKFEFNISIEIDIVDTIDEQILSSPEFKDWCECRAIDAFSGLNYEYYYDEYTEKDIGINFIKRIN